MGEPHLPADLRLRAWNLRVDGLTAEVTDAFEEAGIPVILLKGPSIADWLYADDAARYYGDTDLLVSPRDWEAAQGVLRSLGFADDLGPLGHPRMESLTSYPWTRGTLDNVDLHCSLWGIEASPEVVWETLSPHVERQRVGRKEVSVLAAGPRALHICLHAAQHGLNATQQLEDLRRALASLPPEVWHGAAEFAERLEATGALVTGLRLLPEGRTVVSRLHLQEVTSVTAVLRQPSVPTAEGFEQLASTRGVRAKLSLMRAELFPTRGFMEWWVPLAARGRRGLAAAYAWRLAWLAWRAPRGLLAWRRARKHIARSLRAPAMRGDQLRVAWIGPCPGETGGAPNVGTQLLEELARAGVEVDCYVPAALEDLPHRLRAERGLRFICEPQSWEWNRWYSRIPLLAFFSGNASRLSAQRRLVLQMVQRHRQRRYDVVYQFSQTELPSLRRHARSLPPVVVHPSTHAAGELKWHRREAYLSRRCEPFAKRALVRVMLRTRAFFQKRDLARVERVLGVSSTFSEYLGRDYAIPPERLGVVPNPIDLELFRPNGTHGTVKEPVWLLYVSRMSARKGVEMIVDLSHRLDDLAGRVRIIAIGGATTWSDYCPLLQDLNPATAEAYGNISREELARAFHHAGGLLQPSLYEPFALTVGEALASGLPVVASDEVGAVDGVDPEVCSVFPAGDMDAFERTVRELLLRLEHDDMVAVSRRARAEAERLWAPPAIAALLIEELSVASGRNGNGAANGRHAGRVSQPVT